MDGMDVRVAVRMNPVPLPRPPLAPGSTPRLPPRLARWQRHALPATGSIAGGARDFSVL